MSIDIRQLTIQSIAPANAAIIVGDTLEVAMGKAQGQISAKQNALTLTTTGTSGAATFNQATGALNIPNYATGGGGSSTTLTDNLTTSTTGTALDAHQGFALKGLIDANTTNISTNTTAIAAKPDALTPTAVKTAAYTAAANEFVKTDATSGIVPITLPTAPADKTRIAVKMIAVAGSNTTTITRGGTDVFNKAGGNTTITLTLLNQSLVFQYEAATTIWSVTSGDIPLSGLDGRYATAAGLTTANSNITKANAAITQRNAVLAVKLLALLNVDTSLLVGSATITFARSFNSSIVLSTGLYGDAGNNVAAFTFDTVIQANRWKARFTQATNLIVGANLLAHRDLTQTEWVKTNCTAARTQAGVDGTANAGSLLTATADAATALYSITVASSTRTFSAFVKRIAGGGRVAITSDGGTTYEDITASCHVGVWTRVSMTTTATNPTVGFWLEKSGAAIAIDAVNDTDTAVVMDPCIVRPQDRRTDTLTYSSILSPVVAGGRYYMSAEVLIQGTNSTALKLNTGSATDEMSIALTPSFSFITSYIKKSGGTVVNNSTANMTARINMPQGTRMKFGLLFGLSQMSVLVNDALHYYSDPSYAGNNLYTDIASPLNNFIVQGDADIINAQVAEVIASNLVLAGDSMTANTYFHEMFRNALNPLDWTVFGRGISGNTITDLTARVSTDITPCYWAKAHRNVMQLRIGTNTLANNIDATTALGQLQTLVNTILAGQSGWRIKLVTCITSRTAGLTGITVANFTIQANLYNAGLSSITGIDSVIDLTGVTEATDATNNTYFNGDGIHPTNVLNNIFKPILLKNIW